MATVSADHFGYNMILTLDSVQPGTAFPQIMNEINVSNLRYPGGTVTENQTWHNGGLDRQFGAPMTPGDPDYVMTIREALQFSVDYNKNISIVIPTIQFLDKSTGNFNIDDFNRYMVALKEALDDVPQAQIRAFEIGNEFWAELSPAQYGFIANHQIPALAELAGSLAAKDGSETPLITLQAGAQWRDSGEAESHAIAGQISLENRALVDGIVQHAYPDAQRNQMEWQKNWAIDPMREFLKIEGFSPDLRFEISEFNMSHGTGPKAVFGVNQASLWIEEFARYIDAGVDSFDFWGGGYKWLSTKLYDTKFPWAESRGGEVVTIATPMGQVYDLASTHLVGTRTMTDMAARIGLGGTTGLGITGFERDGQRIVFISNMTTAARNIDLSGVQDQHLALHLLIPADSPHSDWYDETTLTASKSSEIIDARGDMNLRSGEAVPGSVTLAPNQLITLIITDPDLGLSLEGAHNVTDSRTGMVNDQIHGSHGDDILSGHVGDDLLSGGEGNDILRGGADHDTLMGGTGLDRLFGDAGHDILSGGDGNDRLSGGTGNDQIRGGAGNDNLSGNDGTDDLWGDDGHDRLMGGDGNDRLRGGAGHDRLWGGDGDDMLWGDEGNDTLLVGAGNDQLWGGAGADQFVFRAEAGRNIIHDFNPDEDRLVLQGPRHLHDIHIEQQDDATFIRFGDAEIVVLNTDSDILTGMLGLG